METKVNETSININKGIYFGESITDDVIYQILDKYEYYDALSDLEHVYLDEQYIPVLKYFAFQKMKEAIKPQTDIEELNQIAKYYSKEHEININTGIYPGELITVDVIQKIINQYDYEDIQIEKYAFDMVNNAIMPETDMEELNKIAKLYSQE